MHRVTHFSSGEPLQNLATMIGEQFARTCLDAPVGTIGRRAQGAQQFAQTIRIVAEKHSDTLAVIGKQTANWRRPTRSSNRRRASRVDRRRSAASSPP